MLCVGNCFTLSGSDSVKVTKDKWPSSSANVYILPDVQLIVWSAFDLVLHLE